MTERPVALVTGAARGIGRATALELAGHGYDLAVVDIKADELGAVAEEIGRLGGRALALPADLADVAAAASTVRDTVERWDRLDLLVNNAAWRELTSLSATSLESWERTLRVCLTAPAFMAREAAAVMRRAGSGVIINVSSMTSTRGAGTSPAYTVAKAGLDALTYELAAQLGEAGIRVVGIRPGAVDTEISSDFRGDDAVHRIREWSEDAIPLGRWATADEIAKTIVALSGPAATYVTGTTVLVDGGWTHSHFPAHIRRMIQDE